MNPQLIFPETYQLDGFTTNVTSRQAGEPNVVVRELLQNSLDAAVREAGRPAEVHFTICRRPLSLLPGVESYRQAFRSAADESRKQSSSFTNDKRIAIRHIEDVLSAEHMPVLFCRDNGIGLDAARLKSLISEGNSNKASVGAGSYGLGHLTAYQASDLRYILYAGRNRRGDVAGGRAILATHRAGGERRAANGYWMNRRSVFSLEDGEFPTEFPKLLAPECERIGDTGSVVAITGFNYFRDDNEEDAFTDIARATAINFLGAIHQGNMVVHIHDEQTGKSQKIDAQSLGELLEPVQRQMRSPRGSGGGWLVGSQAYRAWQTLMHGELLSLDLDHSVSVWFRLLSDQANERSRVQVFRDGMWISNDAPHLGANDFNGAKPFDAVVLLADHDPEDHGELYDLVRNAEGPEHRHFERLRDLDRADRRRLDDMCSQLASALRERAGELVQEQGYTPPGFAVFNMDATREAAKVPRFRPSGKSDEGDHPERVTGPTGDRPDDPPSPKEKPGKGTGKHHRRRAPSAGTAVRLRRSIVPSVDVDGTVRQLRVLLSLGDDSSSGGSLGLRVYLESGSDETCEQPLAPIWQAIRSVSFDGGAIDGGGETEAIIPARSGIIEIELAEGVDPSAQFELDVVRRRSGAAS